MRKKILGSALAVMFSVGLLWAGGCSTRDNNPAAATAGKTTSAISTDSVAAVVAAVKKELQEAASASATPTPTPATASATPAPATASTPVPTNPPPLPAMSFMPSARQISGNVFQFYGQVPSGLNFTTAVIATDGGVQQTATASVAAASGGVALLPFPIGGQVTFQSAGPVVVTFVGGYTLGNQVSPYTIATLSVNPSLPGATPTPAPTPSATPASTPVPLNTPGTPTANFDGGRQNINLTGLNQASVWTSASASLTAQAVYDGIASGSFVLYEAPFTSSASLNVLLPATGGKTLPAGGNTSFAAAGTGTFAVLAGVPGGLPAGYMNKMATSSVAIDYNANTATGSPIVVKVNSGLFLYPSAGDPATVYN